MLSFGRADEVVRRAGWGQVFYGLEGLWKLVFVREHEVVEEVFGVEYFDGTCLIVDDDCVFHCFEIRNGSRCAGR